MYSFLFSHRSSRSPLVLFFFNLSFSSFPHAHTILSFALFFTALFSFFSFFPFTLQRVQHVQSPIYIMYTSFRDFSNDNVSRSLSHTLPLPFRTQQILKPVRSLSLFFFSIWPAGYAGYVVNARKKNERRKNKTKEREKNKKKRTVNNAITQIRKSIAYSSRHKCARDCSRLLGS